MSIESVRFGKERPCNGTLHQGASLLTNKI
jgi:hypothetical protein